MPTPYVFEDALQQLENILKAEFPAMLSTISTERNDGISLPAPVEYHWEEVKLNGTPAVLLIPDIENDPNQGDIMWDCTIQLYLITRDQSKKMLTKKLLRYSDALKRILRMPFKRTLNQTAVSAKVIQVRYGNTFLDRDNIFARDINAELVVRLSRVGQ